MEATEGQSTDPALSQQVLDHLDMRWVEGASYVPGYHPGVDPDESIVFGVHTTEAASRLFGQEDVVAERRGRTRRALGGIRPVHTVIEKSVNLTPDVVQSELELALEQASQGLEIRLSATLPASANPWARLGQHVPQQDGHSAVGPFENDVDTPEWERLHRAAVLLRVIDAAVAEPENPRSPLRGPHPSVVPSVGVSAAADSLDGHSVLFGQAHGFFPI